MISLQIQIQDLIGNSLICSLHKKITMERKTTLETNDVYLSDECLILFSPRLTFMKVYLIYSHSKNGNTIYCCGIDGQLNTGSFEHFPDTTTWSVGHIHSDLTL